MGYGGYGFYGVGVRGKGVGQKGRERARAEGIEGRGDAVSQFVVKTFYSWRVAGLGVCVARSHGREPCRFRVHIQ